MNIKEFALLKAEEYRNKYITWSIRNPGYVMCNYPIMENACIDISKCNSIKEIKELQKIYLDKYKTFNGKINGFGVMSRTCDTIINELKLEQT